MLGYSGILDVERIRLVMPRIGTRKNVLAFKLVIIFESQVVYHMRMVELMPPVLSAAEEAAKHAADISSGRDV